MMATNPPDPKNAPPPDEAHRPAPVDITEESIAGEEDPGAALDGDDVEEPAPPPPKR